MDVTTQHEDADGEGDEAKIDMHLNCARSQVTRRHILRPILDCPRIEKTKQKSLNKSPVTSRYEW